MSVAKVTEIKSQKVVVVKGKVSEYRVLMKVSFVLQD
jgi:flavin-binding protein dodecin